MASWGPKVLIMPFERYEILLPLQYNDGTPVEPEKFQETRRELVRRFGALTTRLRRPSSKPLEKARALLEELDTPSAIL